MCFLLKIYQFLIIKRKLKNYLRQKALARHASVYPKQKVSIKRTKTKLDFIIKCMNKIKEFYRKQNEKYSPLILKMKTSGTFENYVTMSLIGLVIGILLTFLTFNLNIYHGNGTFLWAMVIWFPMLVGLTGLLAFTKTARCMFLLIPIQLFSSSGKVFIGGEVMILVLEGPVANLNHNLDVIQESSSCQQRGVAAGASEIADILFGPFSSFKEAAMEIVNGIKKMVENLQKMLAAFKRTVMTVADAIQDATKWINSKVNGCKGTVGTTYTHCMDAFSMMYDECKVSVPSIFVALCSVSTFMSNLCSSVKPGEYLCDLVYFSVDSLVTTINQRINRLWDRAYTLMYFKVNIHHEFSMDSNSKSIAEQLKEKLLSAIKTSLGTYFMTIYGFIQFLLRGYFLWSVYRYRKMYMKREDYDNYFITDELIQLDQRQQATGKQSIFPLRRVEKKKYTRVFSVFLLRRELKTYTFQFLIILKSIAFLMIMGLDYVMYAITEKCRLFMLAMMQSLGSRTEVEIIGSGFISELSRRVISALNYMDYNFFCTHIMPCIPNPKIPNACINKKICFLLALFWFSWIAQPYFLRFRHIIMDYYNPSVAKRRARWIYKRIEFKRTTFISFIRIKLKGKYGSGKGTISIVDLLRIKFPCLTRLFGKGMSVEECIICNCLNPPLYPCQLSGCKGVYCDNCYVAIRGVCSLCMTFIKNKDFGNIFLEEAMKDQKADAEEDDNSIDFTVDPKVIKYLKFNYQQGYVHLYKSEENRKVK